MNNNIKNDSVVNKNNVVAHVTKEMNLGEVIFKYPEASEILTDYGLHCVGCFASSFDTIEQGAKIHGMSDEEMQEMIDRINEFIEFGE
jgi:hybrid cluster-associated redox disulfide protein